MTPIKRNLLYIFRGTLLRLRITWNHGDALTLSVGYHVDKKDASNRSCWDGSRCRKNSTHGKTKVPASVINRELEILEDKVAKAFFYFENIDKIPSKDELKAQIEPKEEKQSEKTLINIIDEFIQEQSTLHQWTLSTLRGARKSVMYLVDALGTDIRLDDIDDTQYSKLLSFFFTKKSIVRNSDGTQTITQGLSNLTINGYLNNIRRFVRWAEAKGYSTKCVITKHPASLKSIKKPVIFLEWDELNSICNLDLTYMDTLERARDIFCFSCFTGLRYSDVSKLRWKDVYDNRIEIITQKTNDSLMIELNKFSKQILDKMRKKKGADTDTVFQKMCLSHYNNALITIAKMAGIDSEIEFTQLSGSERKTTKLKKYQCITSHSARRTFVCNSLSLGIPPNIVMKWTGHKNYKSMKPYIDVMSSARKENMDLYNDLPDIL